MSFSSNWKETFKERKWWLAGFFSYMAPGLGQVYCGHPLRGLLFYALYSAWGSIIFILGMQTMKNSFPPIMLIGLFISLGIGFIALLAIIIDAISIARRSPTDLPLQRHQKWFVYLIAIVVSQTIDYGVTLSIRDLIVRPYKIPSVSMAPTLQPGDYILNNKLYYRSANPDRGDVVVFKYPLDESVSYIKRIIGMPGDTLEIRNKKVLINGKILNESYIVHIDSVIYAVEPGRDNTAPVIIPPDHYYVLGDNRDNSLDSRFWGFITRGQIKGKPSLIYWAWKKQFPFIRWDRIGQNIE